MYEYECREHGLFEVLKPLAEYADPTVCPECDGMASRVLSTPRLSGLSRPDMIAHARNEKSRHEPRHAKSLHDHAHPHHAHARAAAENKGPPPQPVLKRYTGARPWVIEHG
ncbi:MAG: FmdB family transcriptional regulator [Myxococcaceae bacterium]|nr:FmdB family transcriptional regulator [Myxococcaceae bacterium]